MDCLFCKIINKEIPSDIVFEDDQLIVIKDIEPKAPLHLLLIPKKHISSLNDITEEDKNIISAIAFKAKELAKEFGVAESGYKLVNNCGPDGGQTVFHLHFHLLGGEKLNRFPV